MGAYQSMIFDYTDIDGDEFTLTPWKRQLTDEMWGLLLLARERDAEDDVDVRVSLTPKAVQELHKATGEWLRKEGLL